MSTRNKNQQPLPESRISTNFKTKQIRLRKTMKKQWLTNIATVTQDTEKIF